MVWKDREEDSSKSLFREFRLAETAPTLLEALSCGSKSWSAEVDLGSANVAIRAKWAATR